MTGERDIGLGTDTGSGARKRRTGELSYKFQRLRERLRHAITSGELTGKLPGERVLAKRYNCNAKTLSKALTDLAAEGLLDRSIGRGTYVKGSAPAVPEVGPWLILGEGNEFEGRMVRALLPHNPRCQLVVGEPQKRPSFVNQFSGVIDLCPTTSESFLRDLVVRGIPVVVVGRESRTYSLDCVLVDHQRGAHRLTQDLLSRGHTRFVAVEPKGHHVVADALRHSLGRPGTRATVDTVAPGEVVQAAMAGATAFVCDSEESAARAMSDLSSAGIDIPLRVSVVAVGMSSGNPPATGCYAPMSDIAESVVRLLGDTYNRRPATLWLAPLPIDRGTAGAVPGPAGASEIDHESLSLRH